MKKENIILLLLNNSVVIAERTITEIYCDLKHIQYGWDAEKRDYNQGPARNRYSEEDVIAFFEQLRKISGWITITSCDWASLLLKSDKLNVQDTLLLQLRRRLKHVCPCDR